MLSAKMSGAFEIIELINKQTNKQKKKLIRSQWNVHKLIIIAYFVVIFNSLVIIWIWLDVRLRWLSILFNWPSFNVNYLYFPIFYRLYS